jgi:hypothetical protein
MLVQDVGLYIKSILKFKLTGYTSVIFPIQVKARGDLIQFGQIHHRTQNQKLRLYEGFVNILGGNDDADRNSTGEVEGDGAAVEKSVDKVVLNLKMLPKMSPLSYLLVYYVREDGETVASMYTIRVNKCFANKVIGAILFVIESTE